MIYSSHFLVLIILSVIVVCLLVHKLLKSKRMRIKLEALNEIITTQKQHIELTNKMLEQKLLRSQINPHFVFNALSAIQHLITSSEKAEALGYLSCFSRLLRQILDSSTETNVLLAEEINMLKAYIELEALRFGNSFSFSIKVDPELDINSYEVPALLVQPVIENAIIHGLMPLKGDRLLKLEFYHKEEEIICIVEDNGIGRRASSILKSRNAIAHKSHGLNITTQRINHRAFNYTHKEALCYTDLVDSEGNPAGTRVRVSIPVYA